jgi:hypothetical protein
MLSFPVQSFQYFSRQYDQSLHWAVSEALFKCVVENDLAGVKTYVEQGEDVNAVNEDVRQNNIASQALAT